MTTLTEPTTRAHPIRSATGSRLVIDAFDMPSATSRERADLVNVVASIKFER